MTLQDAYAELDEALSLPSTRIIHRVVAISHDLLDDELPASDIEAWSREAANRILAARLPRAVLFQPEVLRPPRAALLFMASDEVLAEIGMDVDVPNLLEVWLGAADIDWTRQADRSWPRLEKVSVQSGPGLDQGLYQWLARQTLPSLREARLSNTELGAEAFSRLLASTFWRSLETIVLSRNPLVGHEMTWPASPAVRELRLDYTKTDDEGLTAFLRSGPHALEDLDVSGNPIRISGLSALVAAPLPALRRLSARGTRFSDDPIWELLGSSFWPNLQHLDIAGDGRDPAALVRAGALFASLSSLNLNASSLQDQGASTLLSLPFSRLGRLSIAYNEIGRDGARAVARAPLPDIEEIDISVNHFGDEGLKTLTTSPWWPRIRRVTMTNVGLTDGGLEALVASPPRAIEELVIGTRSFDAGAVQRLREALPPGAKLS
jgi:hypothetical protein